MTSGLCKFEFLADATDMSAEGLRQFEIADGFALTLIGILTLVLIGVWVVAAAFRRREKKPTATSRALEAVTGDQEERSPLGIKPASEERERPWERDSDWWKQGDA